MRKKITLKYYYLLNNYVLSSVTLYKYLGVAMANDLRWNVYINVITQKTRKTLWYLQRNLRPTSTQVKLTDCKTNIRPILEYADVVWDPFTQNSIIQLGRVERKGLRFIHRKYHHVDSVS